MGMTIIEKILARKAGRDSVSVGDTVVVEVDMTVLIDLQFATLWIPPLRIHDADKLAIVMDHAVPAPTIKDASGGSHARTFAADFGINRFFDVGRHGICHQVIAENGLARPGEVLACTDSHTCAAGAYNTAARGLGPAEVYSIMCTGITWYQIAPTIRYELEGVKPSVVSGKDIFLHIANEYGDAANLSVEFGGPGLAGIPMHDRRTIATQGAEVSADFSIFEADGILTEFFDGLGISDYTAAQPDSDATYREVRRIDLGALQPYVARPGTVSRNALPVSELHRQKVDRAFIGSCANGQLEDLQIAANVLSSRPVAALFGELGVAGLVAEEFNSLFFRNAVNAGLPAMTVPDATTVFSDGDIGTFDLSDGSWRNDTTGASGTVPPLPHLILDIISSGGICPRSWAMRCGQALSRCAAREAARDAPDRLPVMPLLGKVLRRFRAGEHRSPLGGPEYAGAGTIAVTSPAFTDGGAIPQKHAGKGVGDNLSPALQWTGVPADARQLVLIMDDLDVPMPKPLMHTIAVIEPDVAGLGEGELKPGTTGVRLIKAFGDTYVGPRPIPGHGPHHYRFLLFALDQPIPHVADHGTLLAAMAGHVVARGGLTGTYER